MLNRLALVLHWLALLIAVAFAVIVGIGAVSTSSYVEISQHGQALFDEDGSIGDDELSQMSNRDLQTLLDNEDRVERTVIDWSQAPILLAALIVPLLLGWAIRFVLSGDNVILPWLKPKDSAQ